MNSFKRTALDTESYIKNRENQFKLMQNNQNRISTIIRKDFLDFGGNNDLLTRGRDSIGLQNDIAIGSGRNVQSLNPSIYQGILDDVIYNQNINNDAKQKIVEEIYRINDNLTINNQVYDNLKSSENSVSFSEVNRELLDTSFEYNLNYLNEFSKQIRAAARNGELNNNQSSINIISNAIQSSSDKAASNSKISKNAQELWDINQKIQDEFDIQNAAHRSKKEILSNDLDLKQNLKNTREFNQEIGNLKTIDDKFNKLPERLNQISDALDAISEEKNKLTERKNNLDNSDKSDRGYKKAKKSYENDLKNLDKEAKGLIKELKRISEFALDKKPSRAEDEKKSILKENIGSKIEKDINYAKKLLNNIKKPDENDKNALENKIEKFKNSNKQMIDDPVVKKAITSINRVRESIQGKLKENAELYKKRDELKANLNKKISVGGAYEDTKEKFSSKKTTATTKSEQGQIKKQIKELDTKIKTNNKSIKESLGSIKKIETSELKNKTKEIKDLNKSNNKSLKFQEQNPLKQQGNSAKRFLQSIEKKLTSFTSRIEERLSRGSSFSSKEALADGKYLSNLANAAKKAVGTASGLSAVAAEQTAESAKEAGREFAAGAKVVGKGALLVAKMPVNAAIAASQAAAKGVQAIGQGVATGAKTAKEAASNAATKVQKEVNNAINKAENTLTDLRVEAAKKIGGQNVDVIRKPEIDQLLNKAQVQNAVDNLYPAIKTTDGENKQRSNSFVEKLEQQKVRDGDKITRL